MPLNPQGLVPFGGWDLEPDSHCILWVDGVQGSVRAMEMVSPNVGPEAIVRTLLQGIEQPLEAPGQVGQPGVPQKIVVRNRELQFFLRGVLQDLDIRIEYQPHLPVIDEFLGGMQRLLGQRQQDIPEEYEDSIYEKAEEIWELGPWQFVADHEILAIEINQFELETLYVSIMGKLGVEFGLLFYRSLNSLKQFRQMILELDSDLEQSAEAAKEAFLQQDCLYLNYTNPMEEEEFDPFGLLGLRGWDWDDLDLELGTIHPLEGIQSHLHEEEAIVLGIALEALLRFFRKHQKALAKPLFPPLSSRFKIPVPTLETEDDSPKTSRIESIKVQTLPDLAEELWKMGEAIQDDSLQLTFPLSSPIIKDDLIPEKSIVSIGHIPWQTYEMLETLSLVEISDPDRELSKEGDGLPVIIIQTTAPKAKQLVSEIKESGGVQAISFNPGYNSFLGASFDLGFLVLNNGEMQIFGEYDTEDQVHEKARSKWDRRSDRNQGICGLMVTKGVTGKARGNPGLRETVSLMQTKYLSSEDLGIGILQTQLAF